MNKKEVESIADKVIDWCAKEYGLSKFYDGLPIIEIDYDNTQNVRAEYDALNNVITVYVRGNRSVRQLIMSVLHEYKHYMQSPTWLERYATMYRRKRNKNPYEKDAEKFADDNWAKCMLDISKGE